MVAVKYLLKAYRRPCVDFGTVWISHGVAALVENSGLNPYVYLSRAAVADWGEVSYEQELDNAQALKAGGTVECYYNLPGLPRQALQIIIEPNKSATTIRMFSE